MKQDSLSQTNSFSTPPWPTTPTNQIEQKSGFVLAENMTTYTSFARVKQNLPSWVDWQHWLAAEGEFIAEQNLNHAHRF
jgi:hypothetical protein